MHAVTLADNIADDLASFDGAETMTVTTASGVSVSVPGVVGRAIEHQELTMVDGMLGMETVVRRFHVPIAALEGVLPVGGDSLTDTLGRRWAVMSVRVATLGTRLEIDGMLQP
jgi:hypothetical protein